MSSMLLGAVDWDWDVIIQTLPYLLKATITTIELAVISIFFGLGRSTPGFSAGFR